MIYLLCSQCGNGFTSSKAHSKYCSHLCRMRFWGLKRRALVNSCPEIKKKDNFQKNEWKKFIIKITLTKKKKED